MDAYLDFEKPIISLDKKLEELKELGRTEKVDFRNEINALETKLQGLIESTYKELTPWQRVQLSRHPLRPYTLDYLELMFTDFQELHGDRLFGDDLAIVSGLAKLGDYSVAVVGQQKGRNTKQKIERNFGMAKPEGYRKALRVLKLAEQFGLPVITFIDTPGAYPGIDAEERGQSEAIAFNIMEMFNIDTPIVACVIGEGGSGGALAVGIGDKVLMQEFSTYSVISPESCATILWSDSSMHERAAQIMKMNSEELLGLGVIDAIVKEPPGGAHRNWKVAAELLKKELIAQINALLAIPTDKLLDKRKAKFRNIDRIAFQAKK